LFGCGDADSFVPPLIPPSPPITDPPLSLFDLRPAAWTKNQPKPVFAEVEQEEEEGEK